MAEVIIHQKTHR